MKVKELIEKLKEFDGELEVMYDDYDKTYFGIEELIRTQHYCTFTDSEEEIVLLK